MRVERFELITKLILSQPPLPIGLHAPVHCRLLIVDCRFVLGLRPLAFGFWCLGPIGNRQLQIGNVIGTRAQIRTEMKQFLKLPCLPVAPREHENGSDARI